MMSEKTKLKIDFTQMDNLIVENPNCACAVTFFKETRWKSSRLVPCAEHRQMEKYQERSKIGLEARKKRDSFFETLVSNHEYEGEF